LIPSSIVIARAEYGHFISRIASEFINNLLPNPSGDAAKNDLFLSINNPHLSTFGNVFEFFYRFVFHVIVVLLQNFEWMVFLNTKFPLPYLQC
jgi:hypothetical protein